MVAEHGVGDVNPEDIQNDPGGHITGAERAAEGQ